MSVGITTGNPGVRDDHGYRKPRGKSWGFAGVGVRVGHLEPHANPYPTYPNPYPSGEWWGNELAGK